MRNPWQRRSIEGAGRRRSGWRWALPVLALLASGGLGYVLTGKLRDRIWAYYTDGKGLKVDVQEQEARMVLWEDPKQNLFQEAKPAPSQPAAPDTINQGAQRVEAAFSPDGRVMVLTRWTATTAAPAAAPGAQPAERSTADLYVSTWDGRTWSRPKPMAELNTTSNERGAAFSRDGQYLYFSSDRDGGAGGYDIYVARAQAEKWTGVERLGESVNTASNETGPAPSDDGTRLYFASDRGSDAGVNDIYVAMRVVEEESADEPEVDATPTPTPTPAAEPKAKASRKGKSKAKAEPAATAVAAPELPDVPTFADAEPVSRLNSTADDVEAAFTDRGDYVFLASDRDRDERSGFNLYLSRVIDGQVMPPEKVDVYVKRGNATDPAVRMDGFDLLFSADAELGAGGGDRERDAADASLEPAYRLYRTTTREVIGYTDLSRWEAFKALFQKIRWWILLAIASLVALIYLLEQWRDITSLFHKCLAGSVMVHLLALFLMMSWMISQAIEEGGDQQAPEVALSADALAQEELAMESEQELARVAETTQMVVGKTVAEFREVEFDPTDVPTSAVPIVQKTADQSLVSDFTPSKENESLTPQAAPRPVVDASTLAAMSPTELPALEVTQLEVAVVTNERKPEPVDLTRDDYKRDDAIIQQVETNKLTVEQRVTQKVDVRSDAKTVAPSSDVVRTTNTGGQTIRPSEGFEIPASPTPLDGLNVPLVLAMRQAGSEALDALPRGEQLETPKHDLDPQALSKLIQKQRGRPSAEVIEHLGGSTGTEQAISQGLDWFTGHQEPDGHWDMSKHEGSAEYDTSGVGVALLCYYGWGIKHGEFDKDGKFISHRTAATKALDWLLKQQKPDGDLRGNAGRHGMYCHGIAAMALCEAYGLTKDEKLQDPAKRSVQFIVDAQHEAGGWRYQPKQAGDLSVTGWQYMALHSARMAGLDVPDEALRKAERFLTSVSGGAQNGLYGYSGPENSNPTMTATGMFMRQLDLTPPTDPRMQESAGLIKTHMLQPGRRNFYYEYYATLALYQHQGPIWEQWNENLKKAYLAIQETTGDGRGSWDPKFDGAHARSGGRVMTTGLAVLSLEVYYRLLPLYGFDRGAVR